LHALRTDNAALRAELAAKENALAKHMEAAFLAIAPNREATG
jgi:hypothetical protein